MCSKSAFKAKSKLVDRLRAEIRADHKSIRTEDSYVFWIVEFVFWANLKNPADMGDAEVGAFLTYLAENNYSQSSSKVALNSLVYFYDRVLRQPLGRLRFTPSARPAIVPDVLSVDEVRAVIDAMPGEYKLVVKLLYGTGMRVMECLQLRIKDLDFGNGGILIRGAKHGSDRVVPLPKTIAAELLKKIEAVKVQHRADLKKGLGSVWLPGRIAEKYPKAEFETKWQYLFPSPGIAKDPRSGIMRRHHIYPSGLQASLKRAAEKCGIQKRVSPHVFRHSFATHLLQGGTSISQVQALLGHKSVETTMIYLHCLDNSKQASPLDRL